MVHTKAGRGRISRSGSVVGALGLLAGMVTVAGTEPAAAAAKPQMLFFVADGMRQDLAEQYAAAGSAPGFATLLATGMKASDNGLLSQAPPITGPGWFSLASGSWPAVSGATNNFFHINGQPFGGRPATSFDTGIVQAETIAQSAERAGLKVAQIEWAGGLAGSIRGPTVEFRTALSGRGVVTNFTSPRDVSKYVSSLGVQYDHPAGYAGQAPYPSAMPSPATDWTAAPLTYSPAQQTRMRVLDAGVDKYGLNAYIYDSSNDGVINYDRVMFSRTKSGTDAVANLAQGEWGDVKVVVQGGSRAGQTAAMLIKVERLASDLSEVRLFHTAVTRASARWAAWPGEPGFTGSFEDYIAATFPSTQFGDAGPLQAGVVSEDTYIEQGLYWEAAYQPIIRYVIAKYQPDLAMVGYPLTDEVQHHLLGLVTPTLPNGAPNPAYDDIEVNGTPDHRVAQRQEYLRRVYSGADATMRLAQQALNGTTPVTTFVASDHGFATQFAAVDASKVLVDLGLLSRPQPSNCRLSSTETIGKAKACWVGGVVQIYLNLAGRDPTGDGLVQVARANETATVQAIAAAFRGLSDPNDWSGDGAPEGWSIIDDVFTKAEARYIPNGPNTTSNMANPTRAGDVIAFSFPPYQFDAATPGTLVALSGFFGHHGFSPNIQDLASSTNMRAAFFAGGPSIGHGVASNVEMIDLAPTAAFLLGIPEPQQSQGRVRLDVLASPVGYTAISVIGIGNLNGHLKPVTTPVDGINVAAGGAAHLTTMFDEEAAKLPGQTMVLSSGDNIGGALAGSTAKADLATIDAFNAMGINATAFGDREFDWGVKNLKGQQARATYPFLAANIVEASGATPNWVQPSAVFLVNGVKVGVIGAALRGTPDLVSPKDTGKLVFLDAASRIAQESARLTQAGVAIQIVLIHDGVTAGANAIDSRPAQPWAGPVIDVANRLQTTSVDLVLAGHTGRQASTMVGRIPVAQAAADGSGYTVSQMIIKNGDVVWTGTANRVAIDLGVTPRPDVQALVTRIAG